MSTGLREDLKRVGHACQVCGARHNSLICYRKDGTGFVTHGSREATIGEGIERKAVKVRLRKVWERIVCGRCATATS